MISLTQRVSCWYFYQDVGYDVAVRVPSIAQHHHHVFKETNSLVCTIKIKIDSDNSLIGHLIS